MARGHCLATLLFRFSAASDYFSEISVKGWLRLANPKKQELRLTVPEREQISDYRRSKDREDRKH